MNAELARLALIVVGSALALGIAGASVGSAVVAWKNQTHPNKASSPGERVGGWEGPGVWERPEGTSGTCPPRLRQ
jgi:hypothetical protein